MSTQDEKGFTFFLQDVRCFKEKTEFNIRPLTFLTGENSTGKSTTLGCLSVLREVVTLDPPDLSVNFNQEPYQMGSFDNIARRVRNGPRSFRLGGMAIIGDSQATAQVTATFHKEKNGSEPVMTSQEYQITYQGKTATFNKSYENSDDPQIRFGSWTDVEEMPHKFIKLLAEIYSEKVTRQEKMSRRSKLTKARQERMLGLSKKEKKRQEKETLWWELESDIAGNLPVYFESVDPIRAMPSRTYDPIKSQISSQGGGIPVLLRNLKKKNFKEWLEVKKGLEQFGQDAGMFKKIEVRQLGTSDSDPFQIYVKVPRMSQVNLIDVGYGVSQVLPLLVQVLSPRARMQILSRRTRFLARRGRFHLLQQPEVHLHPQSQAALISFFINHMGHRQSHRFVIETHSDHIIDRARIEVRRGNIAPEDVSIIYLESKQGGVKVHNLTLDERGHLQNTPSGYRDFFLNEAKRMLGFKKYL